MNELDRHLPKPNVFLLFFSKNVFIISWWTNNYWEHLFSLVIKVYWEIFMTNSQKSVRSLLHHLKEILVLHRNSEGSRPTLCLVPNGVWEREKNLLFEANNQHRLIWHCPTSIFLFLLFFRPWTPQKKKFIRILLLF